MWLRITLRPSCSPEIRPRKRSQLRFSRSWNEGYTKFMHKAFPKLSIRIVQLLDVRYRGQSYELSIPFSEDIHNTFDAHHQKAYGYSRPDAPLEIVNIRVRAIGAVSKPRSKTPKHQWQGSPNQELRISERIPVNRALLPARLSR